MGRKSYNGYHSWSFLEPNKDYRPFKLAKEVCRVPSSKVEEERVGEFIERHILISLHDHLQIYPENPSEYFEYTWRNRPFIGYEGLATSGLDAVFDGLLDGESIMTKDPWSWDNVVYQIGMERADIEHSGIAFIGSRAEDAERAFREGRTAVFLHLEGPPRIGHDVDRIDVLYGLGVRMMGIAYSEGSELGAGLACRVDNGLTDLGYDAVDRMNKLGMIIDLAHAGDRTSMDAVSYSRDLVVISHAGARALWPSRRMKPVEVIKALAEKGGVIGVEAAPHTTITRNHPRHSIESIMEHFQYLEKLVGIDYVAFGPDTLFGDHVALHRVFSPQLSLAAFHEELPEYPRIEYVDGLENPSEFINIVRWLIKHGYSDNEIAKVTGENILRIMRRVLK